jgi:diamine N-acetyltransferase
MGATPSLRLAVPADAQAMAVLATQVWLHTYATQGISAEIAHYVLAELTPARFSASLGDPHRQSLLAVNGEDLMGMAVLQQGAACPAAGCNAAVELQTLYVSAHFVGRGVGSWLLRDAERSAQAKAGSALWLAVNAQNSKAINFYRHRGYHQVGTTWFTLGAAQYENHVLVGPG